MVWVTKEEGRSSVNKSGGMAVKKKERWKSSQWRRRGVEAGPNSLGMSGLDMIYKICISQRTWSRTWVCENVGLRLKIFRNVVDVA